MIGLAFSLARMILHRRRNIPPAIDGSFIVLENGIDHLLIEDGSSLLVG